LQKRFNPAFQGGRAMNYKCAKEQFLNNVKNHKIKTIRDDGLYRHIRMTNGSSNYRYDLITWPGYLCVTGDCGSYLFARIEDMFEFFRNQEINPYCWAEKVLAESTCSNGVAEFSVKKFEENVIKYAVGEVEDGIEKIKIMEEIQPLLECANEWECAEAMRNFGSDIVDFTDFWECDCKEYTNQYIWCLYAIVYAIQKYDEFKEDAQ